MKKIFFVALIIAVVVLVMEYRKRSTSSETVFMTIRDTKISVEVARDVQKQLVGLSGRDSMCDKCGMLFVFRVPTRRNFWMKDMKFPLDLIFIRDNQVVEIAEKVPIPGTDGRIPRVNSLEEADAVLEVNAGFVNHNSVRVADPVRLD